MNTDKRKLAEEMLLLEKRYQAGKLNIEQVDRWKELTGVLFGLGGPGYEHSKSFMLPYDLQVPVVLEKGGIPVACHASGVSLAGFQVHGKLPLISEKDSVELKNISMPAGKCSLGLVCTVVSKNKGLNGETMALSIDDENDLKQQELYYQKVYYPLYVTYLETLARGN